MMRSRLRKMAACACLVMAVAQDVDALRGGSALHSSEIDQIIEKARRDADREAEARERARAGQLAQLAPLAQRLRSDKSLASTTLIDWIPVTEQEFIDVFGSFRASDARAAEAVLQSRDAWGAHSIRPHDLASFAALLRKVARRTAFVVVRGHNVDGRFLIPNGPAGGLPIQDLVEQCHAAGVLCVFVTCNSKRYLREGNHFVIGRFISIDEALAISELARTGVEHVRSGLESTEANPDYLVKAYVVRLTFNARQQRGTRLYLLVVKGIFIALMLNDDDDETWLRAAGDKQRDIVVRPYWDVMPYRLKQRLMPLNALEPELRTADPEMRVGSVRRGTVALPHGRLSK